MSQRSAYKPWRRFGFKELDHSNPQLSTSCIQMLS
jgi:hypothetical protein